MRYLSVEGGLSRAIAMGRPAVALPTAEGAAGVFAAADAVSRSGCIGAPVFVRDGLLHLGSLPSPDDRCFCGTRTADCSSLPVLLTERASGCAALSCAIPAASMTGIPLLAAPLVGEQPAGGLPPRGLPADLRMLTRTPAAVVCGGISAPFDPAACFAGLRRRGVPLLGFGGFPGDFSQAADLITDDPRKIARVLHSKWELGLPGGALILLGNAHQKEGSSLFAASAGAAAQISAAYAELLR